MSPGEHLFVRETRAVFAGWMKLDGLARAESRTAWLGRTSPTTAFKRKCVGSLLRHLVSQSEHQFVDRDTTESVATMADEQCLRVGRERTTRALRGAICTPHVHVLIAKLHSVSPSRRYRLQYFSHSEQTLMPASGQQPVSLATSTVLLTSVLAATCGRKRDHDARAVGHGTVLLCSQQRVTVFTQQQADYFGVMVEDISKHCEYPLWRCQAQGLDNGH